MIEREKARENSAKIRKKLELAGTLRWFHWVIVCSSLLLTLGVWYFTKTQLETKIEAQFNREANQVIDLIVDRMKKYEDALWSGVALIHTRGGDVNFSTWETFARNLRIEEKYPGINGIGVIHHVKPDQLETYLQVQRIIRPDYGIHPTHHETEYWPISYIIPVRPNKEAVGLDISHELNRYTAAKKARDTGLTQITGPIILVQDATKTPGFLFFAPFYQGGEYESIAARRNHFIGMVYAPFVVNKLMGGVLAQHKRHVGLRIIDQENVLYDEYDQDNSDFDVHALFQKEATIPLYGRDWIFDIRSTLAFRRANLNSQPTIILVGGLIIDGLLLGLFILLSRGSRKALAYADLASRDLQLILNSAGEGIYGVDTNGITTFVNPAAAKLLGYSPEELVGLSMHGNIHHTKIDGSHYPHEECPMHNSTIQNGSVHQIEDEVLWQKNGTSFPIEFASTQIRNEQGTIEGVVVIFRDVTELKAHRDEIDLLSERLQIATRSGNIGIWDWDLVSNVLTWDHAMYSLYGISADTFPDAHQVWKAGLHQDDHAQVQAQLEEALQGRTHFDTQFRVVWPDRTVHTIRAFAKVKHGPVGQPVRMTGVNVDISDQKHIESELREQRARLAQSNTELKRFAYVASHDLQEPLRMVSSFTQLLAKEYHGRLDAEADLYIEYAVDGAARMRMLIDGLLEYSQLGEVEKVFQLTDCEILLNEALLNLGPAIADSQAVVTRDPLPIALVNASRLVRVFQNLISNGLKFGGTESPIIHVGAVRQDRNWQFSVTDNGMGIEPEYRKQIFDMFQRLNHKPEYAGSGIGLSICHKIIEHHGGKIWVDSEFGVGSTFYFTIPHEERIIV